MLIFAFSFRVWTPKLTGLIITNVLLRADNMKKNNPSNRPDILEGAPLHYAPQNELGVVFLFSHIQKKLRLTVDEIQSGFPDCIAYQKIGGKQKRIRIEFEFKSRNFKTHEHAAKDCDWIVCWEHNWPDVPEKLRVIELQRFYGLGFNIWIQPVSGEFGETLSEIDYDDKWTVPSLAHKNDLILFYHTTPDKCIKDIFELVGDVKYVKAGWKEGKDYMGSIKRVCQLKSPVFFEDMKQNRILKTSPFVRGTMQGRPKVTEYWPCLFDIIVSRNPSIKKALMKFDPEKF